MSCYNQQAAWCWKKINLKTLTLVITGVCIHYVENVPNWTVMIKFKNIIEAQTHQRVTETFIGSISCYKHRGQVILSKCRRDLPSSWLQVWNFIWMTVEKVSTTKMYRNIRSSDRISMLSLHQQTFSAFV